MCIYINEHKQTHEEDLICSIVCANLVSQTCNQSKRERERESILEGDWVIISIIGQLVDRSGRTQ